MRELPLNALRAFEVAARTGSFSAAARELAVSSAAVSQQVKRLEEYWGRALFVRQGNRITLTEAGKTAYPTLATALREIMGLSDTMKGAPRRARLVISAPHSVAETWLPRALSSRGRETGVNAFDLRIEDDPVDFARDRIHLRIFYGQSLYDGYRVIELFTDEIVAVASPEFAAQFGHTIQDISDETLIHTDWGADYAIGPDWSKTLKLVRVVDMAAGIRVGTSSVAATFALQSLGAALVPYMMVREYLDNRTLVMLDELGQVMSRPYAVAFPHAVASRPEIADAIDALKRYAADLD